VSNLFGVVELREPTRQLARKQSTSAVKPNTSLFGKVILPGMKPQPGTLMSDTARNYDVNQSLSLVAGIVAAVLNRAVLDSRTAQPSGRAHSQLHQLKRKLLPPRLGRNAGDWFVKRLCGAANQAAELAWATSNPLLVYPCV